MKRTVGTVLVGICEIVVGLFFLLMAVGMLLMMSRPSIPPMPGISSPRLMFGIATGFYSVIGALAVATAIGVFMARNWARILTLIAGGTLAVSGALAALTMALVPLPAPPGNVGSEELRVIRFTMVGIWMAVTLVGVWWLILFTRPRIVALFNSDAAGVPIERARPISITILGWFYLTSSIVYLVFISFVHFPTMFFGEVIHGLSATMLNVLWVVVYGVLGIGLLRLDRRALWGTLGMMVFGILNMLCVSLLPGRLARMQEMLKDYPGYDARQAAMATSIYSSWLMLAIVILSFGVPAYFLITSRAAFYRTPHPEVPETLVV